MPSLQPRSDVVDDLVLRMLDAARNRPGWFTSDEILSATLTLAARVITITLERTPRECRPAVEAAITDGLMQMFPGQGRAPHDSIPQGN